MNETNNSALVPRLPGALEKAEPGAKRILSGMVTDTLALVRKRQGGGLGSVARPKTTEQRRIFLVNDNPPVLQSIEGLLRHWFRDLTLLQFQSSYEVREELPRTNPDLLIWVVSAPLLSGEAMFQALMEQEVMCPIVVMSAYDPDEDLVRELARQGLNISFLALPFDCEVLRKLLDAGLEIPRDAPIPGETTSQPPKTRPPRIVVVDDEPLCLESFELIIRYWFKDATLLLFLNSDEGWRELTREDPDLLILDMPLSGLEILPLLAEQKAKYPIVLTSAFYGEEEMRQRGDPNLNISVLWKPFDVATFRNLVAASLNIPPDKSHEQ